MFFMFERGSKVGAATRRIIEFSVGFSGGRFLLFLTLAIAGDSGVALVELFIQERGASAASSHH